MRCMQRQINDKFKVDAFWQPFHYQLSSNFTSRQKTTKKYRVMIEEPVNYKYMYVFSPGDSIACIMKDAVCKFYKEKFQIKKYRESALATYSILLFWNHVTKTLTVVEQRKFPKIFTFEVFETNLFLTVYFIWFCKKDVYIFLHTKDN